MKYYLYMLNFWMITYIYGFVIYINKKLTIRLIHALPPLRRVGSDPKGSSNLGPDPKDDTQEGNNY